MATNSTSTPTTAPLKVVTGVVRGSYVNVFKPRLNELNGKEEYSMTILIPKEDTETLGKLRGAMNAALQAKWPNKAPSGIQKPLHDGDGEKPNGGEYGEECAGHWVMNIKSSRRPGIIDVDMNDVLDPDEFVSGDYCRVSINAYAYDNMRRGVAFGLNNIQVVERGDPLGGNNTSAQEDFGGSPTSGVRNKSEGTGWDDDIPF